MNRGFLIVCHERKNADRGFHLRAEDIRQSVAQAMNLSMAQVGITFTSGDGLTSFGRGEGLMCYALVTTKE